MRIVLEVIKLLQVFEGFTIDFSADTTTTSSAIILILGSVRDNLIKVHAELKTSEAEELYSLLEKYTAEILDPLEGMKEFAVATFLDPYMATGEVNRMVNKIQNNDPNCGYIPPADVHVIIDKNKSFLWENLKVDDATINPEAERR